MTTGETEFGSVERYSPVELLNHYTRLGNEFGAEARNPFSTLGEITRTYAPEFDPTEFPETEAGQAALLTRVGEIIGDKTNGRTREEVLAKRDRPPLTDDQRRYVFDAATYVGTRFPLPVDEGETPDSAGFYPDNLHTHGDFVRQPDDWKVTIEEAGNGRQAKPRRELAGRSTTGPIVQTASDRPISPLKKSGDAINQEYRDSRKLLGYPMSADEEAAVIGGAAADVMQELTEYDIYYSYNDHVGDQPADRETVLLGFQEVFDRADVFTDESGRTITLIQPAVAEGDRASLIDGVRAYLTYLRGEGRLQEGTRLGITTNGQYVAYKELGIAQILKEEFPEVQGLHVIGDETGKRSAEVYLDEIGRLLRNLGEYLTPDESEPAAA